jgi:hypothetical protein
MTGHTPPNSHGIGDPPRYVERIDLFRGNRLRLGALHLIQQRVALTAVFILLTALPCFSEQRNRQRPRPGKAQ